MVGGSGYVPSPICQSHPTSYKKKPFCHLPRFFVFFQPFAKRLGYHSLVATGPTGSESYVGARRKARRSARHRSGRRRRLNLVAEMAIPEQSSGESGTHRPLDPNAGTAAAAIPGREPSPLEEGSQEAHGDELTLAPSSSSHDPRGSNADYGFAGSWPSIPVPLTPSAGLSNRDLPTWQTLQQQDSQHQAGAEAPTFSSAAAATAAAAAASAQEDGDLGLRGSGGGGSGSGSSCGVVGDTRSPSYSAQEQLQATSSKQQQQHRPLFDNNLDNSCSSGLGPEGYQSAWVGASRYETLGSGFDEAVAAATAAAAKAAGVAEHRDGGSNNGDSPVAAGFTPAEAAAADSAAGGGDTGTAKVSPKEQVSLPEDIYGAARVSEYWHGMPALSSLASAYVYDDIWAGDGGLNPRQVACCFHSPREESFSVTADVLRAVVGVVATAAAAAAVVMLCSCVY